MPASSVTSFRHGGAPRWVAALGLAATLTACAVEPQGDSTADVAHADAALDTSGTASLLNTVAERLPSGEERRFSTCPILPTADVEESLSTRLTLPPRAQTWDGSLIQDLTASVGSPAGGDPTVSCAGTWEQVTATEVRHVGVHLMVGLDPGDPVETGRTFGGGQLYTDCDAQIGSCLATWHRDHVSMSVSLNGTPQVADVFDSWVTEVIPAVLHGTAALRVNTVLPPPVTASPVTPPAATVPPAPVAPTGEDCEALLFAAVVNYATGAAPIDPVLAAVPDSRAEDVRDYAEETREWVTTDAYGWELATTDPAGLFGSGQVMASYCLGA